ncbi:MAG: hypothetical protein WA840_19735 [Caulobacteraceae bacterium]
MAAPTSQKSSACPIGFVLTDADGQRTSLTLSIRPEDLSRDDPSRQTVTQTLGGAWLDDFGAGVSTIHIRGNTGWRGGEAGDGVELFATLRNTIWTAWHSARARAVDEGKSPDTVTLIFADSLNGMTPRVAPGRFALKRNRNRPLLMMYELSMTVLSDDIGQPVSDPLSFSAPTGSSASDLLSLGTSSLTSSISSLTALGATIANAMPAVLASPAAALLSVATGSFSAAITAAAGSGGLLSADATSLISISTSLAQAGRNGFYAVGAIPGLAPDAMFAASQVAAAFDNAFCVLGNCFVGVPQYPDYSSLYGASNCSSTIGGSPISPLTGQNALEALFPVGGGPVTVSSDAQANLTVMANSDPVFAPMDPGDLASRFSSIANGVTIA